MLFFNTEDCTDCSLSRLRLSTNVAINKMIADGELTILSITPIKYSKDWAEKAKSYSNNWEIGASDNADKDFDFRVMPNVMLLDEEKRIINKNMNVNDIVNSLNRSN